MEELRLLMLKSLHNFFNITVIFDALIFALKGFAGALVEQLLKKFRS